MVKTRKMRQRGKGKGKSRTKRYRMKNMVGCAKNLGNAVCGKCGVNCLCGTSCNCPKGCKGSCYLNRPINKKKHGGMGCGPNGCPIPALSWARMNQFHGGSKEAMFPLSTVPNGPSSYGPILGVGQKGGLSAVQNGSTCSNCAVQNGGTCGGQCAAIQSGGAFYKPGAPVPGPFVGAPWGTSIEQWPGVNGVGADRNYLQNYKDVINDDPALQMKLGGKKTRGKKHKYLKMNLKRGGGLIPQDLVNLGRDMSFNFKSAYNSLNGYSAPTNPLPYKDQLMGSTKMAYNNLL